MRIIYSNPWGFRIHSPYVYRLVTQGLYGEKISAREDITPACRLNFRQKKMITRVLSLIRFFRAEKISVTDETCFPGIHLREILQKDHVAGNDGDNRFTVNYHRITIGIDPSVPLPEISDKDIWILTNMGHRLNRNLFRDLRLNPLVSISIETSNLGILIFHSSFQKQHYHIRSWFYLC